MISLLVAYSKNNRVIGAQGRIPWKTNFERLRFKKICNGKKVYMGRKTFEEIGHALPYCQIVIVSKSLTHAPEGCLLVNNLEDVLNGALNTAQNSRQKKAVNVGQNNNQNIVQTQDADNSDGDEILIAGGGELYKAALPFAQKIYATEILQDFSGDVFFPELDSSWNETERQHITTDLIPYDYVTFNRAAD